MEPWYKVATPRAEVREGRSFHPDEFAIALEQVVRGTAPGGVTTSSDKPLKTFGEATTTDRIHTAMLLKAAGPMHSARFWRLNNSEPRTS